MLKKMTFFAKLSFIICMISSCIPLGNADKNDKNNKEQDSKYEDKKLLELLKPTTDFKAAKAFLPLYLEAVERNLQNKDSLKPIKDLVTKLDELIDQGAGTNAEQTNKFHEKIGELRAIIGQELSKGNKQIQQQFDAEVTEAWEKATKTNINKEPKVEGPINTALKSDEGKALITALKDSNLDLKDAKTENGQPLINYIVENQKTGILSSLIDDNEIDLKAEDPKTKNNILHMAANAPESIKTIAKKSPAIAEALVNQPNALKETPLLSAIKADNEKAVDELLKINGININQKYNGIYTSKNNIQMENPAPILVAILENKPHAFQTLIEKHPNTLEQLNEYKEWPLITAAKLGNIDIFDAFSKANIPNEKKKEILELRDLSGDNVLGIAMEQKRADLVKKLLAIAKTTGADFKRVTGTGLLPFFYALKFSDKDIIDAFIEDDKSILDLRDKSNDTPILFIVKTMKSAKALEVLREQLKHLSKEQINALDGQNKTVLDILGPNPTMDLAKQEKDAILERLSKL
jgi:ankyrin repeat protein